MCQRTLASCRSLFNEVIAIFNNPRDYELRAKTDGANGTCENSGRNPRLLAALSSIHFPNNSMLLQPAQNFVERRKKTLGLGFVGDRLNFDLEDSCRREAGRLVSG